MGEFKEYLQKTTRDKIHDGILPKLRKHLMQAAEDGKTSIKILYSEDELDLIESYLNEEGLQFDKSLDSNDGMSGHNIYRLQIYWK